MMDFCQMWEADWWAGDAVTVSKTVAMQMQPEAGPACVSGHSRNVLSTTNMIGTQFNMHVDYFTRSAHLKQSHYKSENLVIVSASAVKCHF